MKSVYKCLPQLRGFFAAMLFAAAAGAFGAGVCAAENHTADARNQSAHEHKHSGLHCSPLQLSIFSPLQLVPPENSVCGLRLALFYGSNDEVAVIDAGLWRRSNRQYGLAVGLGNITEGKLEGLQLGLLNQANQDSTAIQLGLINEVGSGSGALQLGLFNDTVGRGNDYEPVSGLQLGLINVARERFMPTPDDFESGRGISVFQGLELGLINSKRESYGLAVGLINIHTHFEGIQIGAYNSASTMRGLQIGAMNFIFEGYVPFLPVINANW